MRGKKGRPHLDPEDPPRHRANKVKGHGTWENDRPPVVGTVGRESGEIRLEVKHGSSRAELQPHVEAYSKPGATVNTDEWQGYNRVAESGRVRQSVCHQPGQRVWAKDVDGDGVNEVHTNTIEGFWTGLRNFLRPFRGVNKEYLQQYVIVHQWAHNLKKVTTEFLRILCGVTQFAT
jgi:transposase